MKQILYTLIILLILSCNNTDNAQATLLNIREIIAHTESEVEIQLGKGEKVKDVKMDKNSWPKYSYKDGAVEVVYMNKKANWITITLNKGKFDKTALGIIGLPVTEPSEANKNVMRWDKFEGIKELDLFSKLDGTIDYFYIKVLNE